MEKLRSKSFSATLAVLFILILTSGILRAYEFNNVPVKGMVKMIDLGAKKCIPCKMMAPIMAKMEKVYKEKAAIVFIDVWEHREQASRFNIGLEIKTRMPITYSVSGLINISVCELPFTPE